MAIYSLRDCRFCGKRYQPTTSRNKHCSPECRFKDIASSFSGDDCWNWPLSVFVGTGYGQFGWSSNPKITKTAHRLSYELFVGAAPDGMLVIHSCDNRKCFNPSHLRAGSYQDNVDDMMGRHRHSVFDAAKMKDISQRGMATKARKYGPEWGRILMEAALVARHGSSAQSRQKDVTIAEQSKR